MRVCVYVCVSAKFDFQFSFSDLPHTRCSCVFFSLHASNCHKIIAYSRASALMVLCEIGGIVGTGRGGCGIVK